MKIVLIGFMGSGKSTLAKILAEKLHLQMYEMDDLILSRSGRASIPEIFAVDGEAHFRKLESEMAKELGELESGVISTGGGVITHLGNIESLRRQGGRIVYLRATFETIQKRLTGDTNRPLFQDLPRARQLYGARSSVYEKCSQIIIDTDTLSTSQITKEICERLTAPSAT